MKTVNIHDAKTQLSRLLERAAAGEPFIIIAKAGKPLVRVLPIDPVSKNSARRIGFLKNRFHVPDDFDTMEAEGIDRRFEGRS